MYHKFVVTCKKCGKPMTIVEVHMTRGTEIMFEVLCVQCSVYDERIFDFLDIQAELRKVAGITIIEEPDSIQ